jgi:hypothetical protein
LDSDIIVVGAGIAGLACAREARAAGLRAMVLDKAKGVGGRCATRRISGAAVDFGVTFLHGSDPAFQEAVASVTNATPLPGWPRRVDGYGTPCQPGAFSPGEKRFAYVEGLTAFPKHLASGLEVRLRTCVARLEVSREGLAVVTETSERLTAKRLVLALPAEQALELLGPLCCNWPSAEAARHLLRMLGTVPCLTVMAGYAPDRPAPEWDICYPEDSQVLTLMAHDSAKRREPRNLVLVYQAQPRWSRQRLDADPEAWSGEILREAGRRLGAWAASPEWVDSHRWRFARAEPGNVLAGPWLSRSDLGFQLGLAGELFGTGGGAEGAWRSGREIARRMTEEA